MCKHTDIKQNLMQISNKHTFKSEMDKVQMKLQIMVSDDRE